MGLNSPAARTGPLVAPAPRGIIDPATGRPIGAHDPYFREVNCRTGLRILFFVRLGYARCRTVWGQIWGLGMLEYKGFLIEPFETEPSR
jgi:hypothetical protein